VNSDSPDYMKLILFLEGGDESVDVTIMSRQKSLLTLYFPPYNYCIDESETTYKCDDGL
jgi:hypothetical protein